MDALKKFKRRNKSMKKFSFLLVFLVFLVSLVSIPAFATTYDIHVNPEDDVVSGRWWGYFGNGTWTNASASPNQVSHRYEPGDGESRKTSLKFYTSSFTESISDITSVTFNYNVLSAWTDGRDDIGNFSGIGNALYSNGLGMQSIDLTYEWTSKTEVPTEVSYLFNYTGYSGFTFGSANGGDPSFLRIITADSNSQLDNPSNVPEPGTLLLLFSGLIGVSGISRRREH
jgi:hypothetical protein